ncbi:septal ring lytic transglycosylase RlpA family protein [Pseudomonas sp. 10B1]|uniref:septal ring lytic transglycosylase RlpA family protein n=1 Tax=unclassified Pseudomonas TaxID=196821 RepID=UPI002AB57809|nr:MULTISPECIES: septal ring lytic transglycosylase RlpA family protein [unclassified Pseudomonas]MDY7561881.1 septal ring lytic transglycosylase RlpA family protein [Pseudomonas sp. AB6]MEA9976091.1 septal ring lytic transglycosylase RlpA family protein [Pseudomonas sp. RTS4]MEA9995278.1 septal ring lytic transglycosylase RlpA family protein [Pseudomonas sp. AA4]MEB0087182.1 septal ring lytic transglycosylase RlpA family protein [Pseudomonas sp. RTI1]MEB0127384.1 septal ring lytic transglycos
MWRLFSTCALLTLLTLLAGCAGQNIDPRGYNETGSASFYGAKHQGKRTASGERFDQNLLTAAHRDLPFGTRLLITNLGNDKTVEVRVNDRGPHSHGRLIDLSRKAAEQLGMLSAGVARVRVQTLGD